MEHGGHRQDAPTRSEEAERARRRRYQLGALLVTAAAVAAVLVTVLGADSTSELAPGKPVPGAARTLALLEGIPQQGTTLGSPQAPATMVEFGDLQCPACAEFAVGALPQIVSRYVRTGRLRLTFYPLEILGSDSTRAASMALALARQNRMWQFSELMYRNQGLEQSGFVTDRYLRALASAIPGVDVARALSERSSPATREQLHQARARARAAQVKSTPSFLLERAGSGARRFSPSGLGFGAFDAALGKLVSGQAA
jgi:protein-disulfide isomerase